MSSYTFDYNKAFARNLGLTTNETQASLQEARVAIPGMGGVGGQHLLTLARMGVGRFHIADSDEFDIANLNRQAGAFMSTMGQDKTSVMKRMLEDVNPQVDVKSWSSFIDESNINDFLDGVDLVIDSVDAFAVDARLLIFREAYARKIPVVTAGPIGFSTCALVQMPHSMSMNDYLDIRPHHTEHEKFCRFIAGLSPKPTFLKYMNTGKVSMGKQRGPCIASSVALCAGIAGTLAFKAIVAPDEVRGLPEYYCLDPYVGRYYQRKILLGNRHPLQKLKIWYIQKRVQPS